MVKTRPKFILIERLILLCKDNVGFYGEVGGGNEVVLFAQFSGK